MRSAFYLPSQGQSTGPYVVEVTPESAGWGYSSLRIMVLDADGEHRFDTGPDEILVVPLSGSVTVEVDGSHCHLEGRDNVFAGPTDFAYVGIGAAVTLRSAHGGRFALCGARTDQQLPLRHLPAADVSVELRGAGQSSRQVRNFGTPGNLDAGAIIACEVITPGGNWSSYPAHKHDEAGEHESELEEIYYFEISEGPAGQPGFGFMRTSSSPGRDIDLLEEVHDGDTVLVPFGWHGPCVAAPGFEVYYLNVMAGPPHTTSAGVTGRAWKISDHPDQTWVRDAWADQAVDPRLAPEGHDSNPRLRKGVPR